MNSAAYSRHAKEILPARRGITVLEAVIVIAIIGLLLSLAWPWVLSVRENTRQSSCRYNLRQLGMALNSYHETYGCLPSAAVWSTRYLESLALHNSQRIDLYTQMNWAQRILPFAGHTELASQFHLDLLIADPENERGRNTRVPLMICSSDTYSVLQNPYVFEPNSRKSISFARGNYAINGGSNCFKDGDGSTAFLTGDSAHLEMSRVTREFKLWGNGVAGFNVCFSYDDFENGKGSLVMLDELRAGIHPMDPRGVWALGQIGGSVTWAHGVNGDAYGPNNQEPKSDDVLNGDLLNRTVGAEFLRKARMPCVPYGPLNSQTTSRSSHSEGVNVLMVDGASRFVSDKIDPGLWHALHSREAPQDILKGDLDALISSSYKIPDRTIEAIETISVSPDAIPFSENTIGIRFVQIPAGVFEMGLADHGNSHDLPPESPQHSVSISNPFYLSACEVTRLQYFRIMGPIRSNESTDGIAVSDVESMPVVHVTWHNADEFCRKLSALPEEKAARHRFRLPTEAEWEYACRAGNQNPYEWSSQRRVGDESGDAAGILPPLPLRPVGSYPPNAFGLYDMRGNTWEWCADWFDRDYYHKSPARDPQGPRDGYIKVIRGSSWTFVGEGCKLSYPMMPPWKSSPFVGFRIVCEFEAHTPDVAAKSNL